MNEFERRTVFGGNDAVGNREMKHITADGLREITDRLLTFTAETFDDGCPAHALVVNACGEFVCVMSDGSMRGMDCFADSVAHVADEGDAVAVMVVRKSWVAGDDWDGVTPPSQCPGRWEALAATVETAEGMSMHLWPILRNGNSVRLGECVVKCGDVCAGRLTGLLRRPRPELK